MIESAKHQAVAAHSPACRIPMLPSMLLCILRQELERTAAAAHAQHQSEQAERSRQRAPSPRSGSPSPASRLLRVAVLGPTAMALQAQQQLLPQLSQRVSDLRKQPRQRRVSLRPQRSGSLQRKGLGQPCQHEVLAQTQGSLQMAREAADQLLQQQQQARAGELLSASATGGEGRSQEVLGEQQELPAVGLQDRPAWHPARRVSVEMHLPPSGRSAAVADLATHGHSAQLAGAITSEPESKQVQANLGAAAAPNQAGEAGRAPAGVQAQHSDSQADPRLDGALAAWCQDRGQSMPVKLRRQDSLQQQKLRLQRQEQAMQVRVQTLLCSRPPAPGWVYGQVPPAHVPGRLRRLDNAFLRQVCPLWVERRRPHWQHSGPVRCSSCKPRSSLWRDDS